MVVTSLIRPYAEQVSNSHQLSVHPAGMAVDLRLPPNPECREFLEDRLLEKEGDGLVDITRERAPPHYHVAVFPEPYEEWADTQPSLPGAARAGEAGAEQPSPAEAPGGPGWLVILGAIGFLAVVGAASWYLRGRARPDG